MRKSAFSIALLLASPLLAETPTATATPTENILLAPVASATPAAEVEVLASLREKGTRRALPDLAVYVFPGSAEKPIKALTDKDGVVRVNVPAGPFKWVVSASGYERFEQTDSTDDAKARVLYVRKTSYSVYETTVYGKEDNRDDRTKTLSQSEFLTMPGANGDPVKAVQNLPGVNRAPFLGAQVIIEGSAPQDTGYSIDTQRVPIIFHFTGLSSVVIPEAIDRVDYLSAGYGPEFGDSLSGLVNLYTRSPKTDRLHGMGFVDLLNTGGLIEGPIGEKTSFLIGGRQSYIGAVLKAATSNNSDFNFTVAPDFRDLIAELQSELSERDVVRVVGFGSQDSLGFLLSQPVKSDPSVRGTFSNNTDFYRLIPQWVHKHEGGYVSRYWLTYGQDKFRVDIGSNFLSVDSRVAGLRAELEAPWWPSWKAYLGLQQTFTWSDVEFRLPKTSGSGGISNPVSGNTIITDRTPYDESETGVYWRNLIRPEGSLWTFIPGVRADYYNRTRDFVVLPRLAARYALDPTLTLRTAGGLYSQIPQPQELSARYGNPALRSQRAWHLTVGAEKDFRNGWTLSSDAYYKRFYQMVIQSSIRRADGTPEYYNNDGTGDAYGIGFLGKYQGPRWSGWLSYTLSRSTRINPPDGQSLFRYDQTHAITLLGQYQFAGDWKISGRVRYISGNPFTSTTGGVFDVDNDVYLPVRGPLFGQRLEPFFQLDVRVDKKWVFNSWILSAYLDVQNATNRMNPQAVNYSFDYSQTAVTSGPPILPTIGVKGEF